jgi:hypothetical protein
MLIYMALSLFVQSSFETFRLYTEYTLCQLSSLNIFQFLNGVNYTDINNKNKPDPNVDWKGLYFLNETFMTYYKDLQTFQADIVKEPLMNKDYVASFYDRLNEDLGYLKGNISNNDFSILDLNHDIPTFNLNYKCFECVDDTLLNQAIKELDDNFVIWYKRMENYRLIIYDALVNSTGWLETQQRHNDTEDELRKVTVQTFKFYNNVMTYYDGIQQIQQGVKTYDYASLFIIGGGVIMTIIGYKFIKNCKMYLN